VRRKKVVRIPLSKRAARELKKLERKTGLTKEELLKLAVLMVARRLREKQR